MLRIALVIFVGAMAIGPILRADQRDERVAKLITELKSEDAEDRQVAAWELGKLGRAARRAEPDLARAFRDPEKRVRGSAAEAFLRIGGEPRIVRPLLEDPENTVRFTVAEALIAVHGDVVSATPVLFELRHL